MTIFRTRWTPREWTTQLTDRLRRLPSITDICIAAPLRISLSCDGYGPLHLDATASYDAYQRAYAGDTHLLDTTVRAIADSLARLGDPPTWDSARNTVTPWLLSTDDSAVVVTCGAIGDLAIAFTFAAPVTGNATFVTSPAWGVDRETLLRRALANLAGSSSPPSFRLLPDGHNVLRLLPADRHAASRTLLPDVQRAITARLGSPAVLLIAARDAVFVCPPTVLGDPPPSLRQLPAIQAALNSPDALSDRPILLQDRRLASR